MLSAYSLAETRNDTIEIVKCFLQEIKMPYTIKNHIVNPAYDYSGYTKIIRLSEFDADVMKMTLVIDSIHINKKKAFVIARNYAIPKSTLFIRLYFKKEQKKWVYEVNNKNNYVHSVK